MLWRLVNCRIITRASDAGVHIFIRGFVCQSVSVYVCVFRAKKLPIVN